MTTLTADGLPFDHSVQVHGLDGVRTAPRHHKRRGLRETLAADARPLINGHPWDGAAALALVTHAAGGDAWLEAYDGPERHWPDAERHIGAANIRPDAVRGRCSMTTVDPDPRDGGREVRRDLGRRGGGRLALNADVVGGGDVNVGGRRHDRPSQPRPARPVCGESWAWPRRRA